MSLILDPSDRRDLVMREVAKLPGKKSTRANYTMVQCPFHNDSNPSGQIKHSLARPRSIGYFTCRGCGKSMPWKEFSEAMSLEPFQMRMEADVPNTDLSYIEEECFGESDSPLVSSEYRLFPLNAAAADRLDLPAEKWRGFTFRFLSEVGAQLMYEEHSKAFYVFLPVMVNGELKGYIRAQPKKPDDKSPSYLNARGTWASTHGLFPFDYAVSLMTSLRIKTIVLCEGPRDALRLCRDGIPAMAILGTQSWTTSKVQLLEQSGADSIILCFDADAAGKKATSLVYTGERVHEDRREKVAEPLSSVFNVFNFPLREYLSDGQEKLDPYEAPPNAIEDLKQLLE